MTYDSIQQILNKLDDHEKRIILLENNKQQNQGTKILDNKPKTNKKNKAEDLHPPIQKLFKDSFFIDSKTDLEVCNALALKLLTKKTPLRASVTNVLRAMVKKGLLSREQTQKDKRLILTYKQAA